MICSERQQAAGMRGKGALVLAPGYQICSKLAHCIIYGTGQSVMIAGIGVGERHGAACCHGTVGVPLGG